MTTTTNQPVSNAWTEIADSSFGDTAVTVQNHLADGLAVHIDSSATPTNDDLGVLIKGRDKELYAGFEGKIRVRYPHLADGEIRYIGVMKS